MSTIEMLWKYTQNERQGTRPLCILIPRLGFLFVSWQGRLLQREWRKNSLTVHVPSSKSEDTRGEHAHGGCKAAVRLQGCYVDITSWQMEADTCSLESNSTFRQTAGKPPSELNRTWWEQQQRPGDQMPSLKPFVRPTRHLVGSMSHWLPDRQQLAGLLVHTLFPFMHSWVAGPIATWAPASAWVALHQLWCTHTAPREMSLWNCGWGCRRIVGQDLEDAVGSTGDRERYLRLSLQEAGDVGRNWGDYGVT